MFNEETMKRLFPAGFLVVLAVLLIAASLWARRALSIDSCLDRGGRWNDEVAACEGTTE
jgi:hypothetical protein